MTKCILIIVILHCFRIDSPAQIKVACIGNSITYGFGADDPKSYPSQLNSILGRDWEVKNFGVSGSTLLKKGDFPYYKQKAWGDVKMYNPDVVLIKLGTNDSKPQNWKHKDDFVSDYTSIVNELKALPSSPVIIICTPVPTFQLGWGIRGGVIKYEIIPMLKGISKKTDVILVNLFKPLIKHGEYFLDGIHPDEAGAAEIAKIVSRTLSKNKTMLETRKNEFSHSFRQTQKY